MSREAAETAVLESIVPQLEAEGFEVYAHPSAHLLPPFLQAYSPDAIARREDKNLAIEVLRRGSPSEKKLDELRALLSGKRDWELRVYWVSPSSTPESIEAASRRDIEHAIKSIEALTVEKRFAPALLMAWATLEGLGRALLPDKLVRVQTPQRLVEVLASDGYVTPTEADHLRRLGRIRNRVIHGGLSEKIGSKDLKGFATVLRALRDFLTSNRNA
jgi:hypothetical protein